MSFFTNLIEDLKTKHLWPVALALLIGLIAVPLLLAKPAKESTPAPPLPPAEPAAAADGPGGFQSIADIDPIVVDQPTFPNQRKKDRKFVRKNPFAGVPSGGDDAGTAEVEGGGSGTEAGTDTGSTGDTTTPTGDTGGTPSSYHYVATARFGEEGKKKKTKKLTSLRSLPSSDNAVVVFLGVRSDGKTAVFLLSSSATSTGDGKCVPSDDECSFIHMKKNDVQTIESVSSSGEVTTYELKLVGIKLEQDSTPTNSNGTDGGGDTGIENTDDPTATARSAPVDAQRRTVQRAASRATRQAQARKRARQQRRLDRQQRKRQKQAARVIGTLGF